VTPGQSGSITKMPRRGRSEAGSTVASRSGEGTSGRNIAITSTSLSFRQRLSLVRSNFMSFRCQKPSTHEVRLTMRRTPLPIGAMSGRPAPAEPYTTEDQNGDTVIAEGSATFIWLGSADRSRLTEMERAQ
jgi:hypothetical protein